MTNIDKQLLLGYSAMKPINVHVANSAKAHNWDRN